MADKKELSQKEVSHRVAVLKRFRELLKNQRDRFASYLDALDRSRDVIERGTADDLLRHVELEERILSDIHSIQKVIDPLEGMYRSLYGESHIPSNGVVFNAENSDDVPSLKSALALLGKEAASRSDRNRKMLSRRMSELRAEIKSLRSNPFLQKRGYQTVAAPTVLDIRG